MILVTPRLGQCARNVPYTDSSALISADNEFHEVLILFKVIIILKSDNGFNSMERGTDKF
jgi:hypothetical protein